MSEKHNFLCTDCAKDIYLKRYIKKNAADIEYCTICQESKTVVNISIDENISTFFRFLIRYHWPEYIYNSHWGGIELPKPFYSENLIISHEFAERKDAEDEDAEESFFTDLLAPYQSDDPVDLYYGHDSTGRGLHAHSIKDQRPRLWDDYKAKLKNQNYYLVEREAEEVFKEIIADLEHLLAKGEVFFRARIGYDELEKELEISLSTIKVPYTGNKISAPPISVASAGRANRQGVSYLYLGSDQETAMGGSQASSRSLCIAWTV